MPQFLGLSWHPALDKFISEHMMVEEAASKQGPGYISGQSEVSSRSPTLCTTPYFGERRKVLLRTIFLVIFCFRVADKWRKELGEAEAKEMEAVCGAAIRSHEELTMLA